MDEVVRDKIMGVLRQNVDLFAWSLGDMLGIDPGFLCHHLSIITQVKIVAKKIK